MRAADSAVPVSQAALVEELLPALSVPAEGPLDAITLFGDDRPLHFEIGFGAGEHLAFRADLLPDHGFIGAEPFLNGVAAALGHIQEKSLANVRLHMGDALEVLERLPEASLRFVHLLHQVLRVERPRRPAVGTRLRLVVDLHSAVPSVVAAGAANSASETPAGYRRAPFAQAGAPRKISDNLYVFEDTCRVYVIRDGSSCVLIVADTITSIPIDCSAAKAEVDRRHCASPMDQPCKIRVGVRIFDGD